MEVVPLPAAGNLPGIVNEGAQSSTLGHNKHRQPHLLLINPLRIDRSSPASVEEDIAEFSLASDRVLLQGFPPRLTNASLYNVTSSPLQ